MDTQTPMMRQYHEIKRQHPEMLLFFRLGDFYEMFFQDAVVASEALEITLTSRNKDRQGEAIPMCGVPHHAVNSYLARLIKQGHKVAICEQTEDPRVSKGIVRREVTRVVTPGTAIEAGILEGDENNFIASLHQEKDRIGGAFLDLSTGEFWIAEFTGEDGWEGMRRELHHHRPSEILLPQPNRDQIWSRLPDGLRESALGSEQPAWTFQLDYGERLLLEQFQVATLEGFGIDGQRSALCAAGALLHYIRETQKSRLDHILRLQVSQPSRHLVLDETTVENLELVRGSDGNKRWTLLETLDSTKTAMGRRQLRQWILKPSLELEEIRQRQDAVAQLHQRTVLMGSLEKELKPVQDLERLLGRITMGTATPRDLVALKTSLEVLPQLASQLQDFSSPLLAPPADLLEEVVEGLEGALVAEPPPNLNDGGVIRPGFDTKLDELRELTRAGKQFLANLEAEEREKTGISSLKVKYNKVFGYFIEVTKTHLKSVPAHYLRKQTLVGSERYSTPQLKEYEEKVLTAEEERIQLEKQLFQQLRQDLAVQAKRIQITARFVARLDCLLSLAEAASRYGYVRPEVDESRDILIRGGRHPVVERNTTEPFVPNDLDCGLEGDQLLILTGPNMGGKSTYLRQNALITIMAQMGSFVPAQQVRLGLVDRIYTRVGASDNLARGRSTFLVEMIETANILNSATNRSLILLDEVGRGTATFDGLSIAWSVAEYLLTQEDRRARTLFATHYQELTRLETLYPRARNYCVTVQEAGDRIVFFHRVLPGAASRSYGIEVARLAGMPLQVLDRAREILGRLERKELRLGEPVVAAAPAPQKTLFEKTTDPAPSAQP